jgi:hypothetical protein
MPAKVKTFEEALKDLLKKQGEPYDIVGSDSEGEDLYNERVGLPTYKKMNNK